ncbi:LysR family transcriptional regulator [Martelella soudanensis]|uniref:LysR family transcriptional regulator n=1 Tax=unclassified Martelella TaxID=2629616 RepID=UPI0015DD6F1E|nr:MULTISPECIES: LysR family transcriptional regulator [unclassified Martelella]
MITDQNGTIDVRFLRTTFLLLSEQNVSRVAGKLGQSQPSVSAVLKRARQVFDDPLLVRSGQSMAVTERGEAVRASLCRILAELSETISPEEVFDPATTAFAMRVSAMSCFNGFLIPPIAERLRKEAPMASIDFFAPAESDDLTEQLSSGASDLLVANWPSPHESLRSSTIFDCETACIMRADHPFAKTGDMSLEDYLAWPHLSLGSVVRPAFSPIGGRLKQLGVNRRVALSVPEYALVPPVITRTDLIFTTARPYAEFVVDRYPDYGLRVVGAPREFGNMRLYLLWHERAHKSPANRWVRNLIRDVSRRYGADLQERPTPAGMAGLAKLAAV